MFGSVILDVIVGMVFVFLLVSILCTAIREAIEGIFKSRAAFLVYGIRKLLAGEKDKQLVTSLFAHPQINGLFSGSYSDEKAAVKPGAFTTGGDLPSHIPSRNFAIALLDIAVRGAVDVPAEEDRSSTPISIASLRHIRTNIKSAEVQRIILSAIDTGKGDIDEVIAHIEAWYNTAMQHVSEWYRRSTAVVILIVGLLMSVGANINAIRIGDYIYRDGSVRTALLARAEAAAKNEAMSESTFAEAKRELESLRLPIGWDEGWAALGSGRNKGDIASPLDWMNSILGWLITTIATMLGAPFWFELMKKLMSLRSTGRTEAKS